MKSTKAGTALSMLKCGLLPLSQRAQLFQGKGEAARMTASSGALHCFAAVRQAKQIKHPGFVNGIGI